MATTGIPESDVVAAGLSEASPYVSRLATPDGFNSSKDEVFRICDV